MWQVDGGNFEIWQMCFTGMSWWCKKRIMENKQETLRSSVGKTMSPQAPHSSCNWAFYSITVSSSVDVVDQKSRIVFWHSLGFDRSLIKYIYIVTLKDAHGDYTISQKLQFTLDIKGFYFEILGYLINLLLHSSVSREFHVLRVQNL